MKKKLWRMIFVFIIIFLLFTVYACESERNSKDLPTKRIFNVVVTGGLGSGKYGEGQDVTITALDIPEKEFLYWLSGETKVSENSSFSFVVLNDWTVEAIYGDRIYYYEVVSDVSPTSINYVQGAGRYALGSQVSLEAKKIEYGTFLYWISEQEIISEENPYVFTVSKNIKIKPVYEFFPLGMNFSYNAEKDGYIITEYSGVYRSPDMTLPQYYNDDVNGVKPVVEIAEKAFNILSNNEIKTLTIKEGIEKLGKNAIWIRALEKIYLPESLKIIEEGCFLGCYNIKEITVPKNVQTLGEQALSCSQQLENIFVDDQNQSFCDINGVLFNKEKTTLIMFPEGKTCDNQNYEIPESVQQIEPKAFSGYLRIDTVEFNNSTTIKAIGKYAFYKTENLNQLNIPKSVETIEDHAFYSSQIAKIEFETGSKLEKIGEHSFDSCTKLSKLMLPERVREIGQSAFERCVLLWEIEVPEQTTAIGERAFYNCEKLYRVTINSKLVTIGGDCFVNCNIHSVTVFSASVAAEITSENAFGELFKKATSISIGNGLTVTEYIQENYIEISKKDNYTIYSK